jgi:hypothetical protein
VRAVRRLRFSGDDLSGVHRGRQCLKRGSTKQTFTEHRIRWFTTAVVYKYLYRIVQHPRRTNLYRGRDVLPFGRGPSREQIIRTSSETQSTNVNSAREHCNLVYSYNKSSQPISRRITITHYACTSNAYIGNEIDRFPENARHAQCTKRCAKDSKERVARNTSRGFHPGRVLNGPIKNEMTRKTRYELRTRCTGTCRPIVDEPFQTITSVVLVGVQLSRRRRLTPQF